jgi:hypothetical protein
VSSNSPTSTPRRIGDIPKAITRILTDAGEPLHVTEIHRAVERLLDRPVNYSSVKSCLSGGVIKPNPKFRRIAYGRYEAAV